ncbi:MAG: MFS transporter [Sulfolobaceae archaeon]|nr:MFS transporter [Sulfolobaceae archaeon]
MVSPFISFYSASTGISGEMLAIITSAGTTLPGVTQFILSFIKSRAKMLLFISTLVIGISWLIIGSLNILGSLFVVMYIIIEAGLGAANLGWLLIVEKISVSKRGSTLALYSFYGAIGGLFATLITGIIVRGNLYLMRYFFITAGTILLFDAYVIYQFDVDAYYKKAKVSYDLLKLRKFLMINSIFTMIWSMAWPLFPLAQIYKFHMTELDVGLISISGSASTIALQRLIGKLTDSKRKYIMFAGRLGLATFPLAYALATNVTEIIIANAVSGFTNSASISYYAYLFDNSQNKRFSIALYNFLNGISALVGSSLGSFLLYVLIPIYGIEGAVVRLLFMIGILRILGSLMYLLVGDVQRK